MATAITIVATTKSAAVKPSPYASMESAASASVEATTAKSATAVASAAPLRKRRRRP